MIGLQLQVLHWGLININIKVDGVAPASGVNTPRVEGGVNSASSGRGSSKSVGGRGSSKMMKGSGGNG